MFNGPHLAPNDIQIASITSVTKQAASRIDIFIITFHTHRNAKEICAQSYIENFKITVDDAGNNTYPGGGVTRRTWNDHIQYQLKLDALNLNNNSLVGFPTDYYYSCNPVIMSNTVGTNWVL
jgi:hypothetical protein